MCYTIVKTYSFLTFHKKQNMIFYIILILLNSGSLYYKNDPFICTSYESYGLALFIKGIITEKKCYLSEIESFVV